MLRNRRKETVDSVPRVVITAMRRRVVLTGMPHRAKQTVTLLRAVRDPMVTVVVEAAVTVAGIFRTSDPNYLNYFRLS